YEIDAERYVTGFAYDSFGNQTALTRYATRPAESLFGTKESSAPNPGFKAGELAAMLVASGPDRTITTTFDALGPAVEVRQAAAFTYDSSAPVGSQYPIASPTTRNTYDAFGELVRQSTLVNANTGGWSTTTFYYDKDGRKSAVIDALGYL